MAGNLYSFINQSLDGGNAKKDLTLHEVALERLTSGGCVPTPQVFHFKESCTEPLLVHLGQLFYCQDSQLYMCSQSDSPVVLVGFLKETTARTAAASLRATADTHHHSPLPSFSIPFNLCLNIQISKAYLAM